MSSPKSFAPIHRRVLMALLLAGLLPVVLISVATQFFTRQAMLDYEYDKMSISAEDVARQIRATILDASLKVKALCSDFGLVSSWITQHRHPYESPGGQIFLDLFSDVTLYDTNGLVLYASSTTSLEDPYPLEGLYSALHGDMFFLPPHVILGNTNLFISVFSPVRGEQGRIEAVMGANLPMDKLWKIIERGRLGEQGFFVLLDEHGNLLAGSERERLLTKFDPKIPPEFWVKRNSGIYRAPSQETMAFVSIPISLQQEGLGGQWILLGLKPHREILMIPRQEMRLHMAAAAVTLGVILLMGLLISRKLSRPVTRVAKAVQQVSQGDLDAVIPESGPQEVRQLAVAFNQMVQELRQHRTRMENMVQQRTLKLRDSQRQLEQLTAHLRSAYESIIDGILIMEWPSGKVIAANHNFASLFGLDAATLLGKMSDDVSLMIRDHFVEQRDNAFRWDHYQKFSEETALEEWELIRPARLTLSVYTGPVGGAHGQVFARLWMFRDLSKQRLLEAELLQAQKMEAIGRLAGGIAHDFNNLLTGILGNLTMAEMELKPSGEAGNFIVLARQAAKRAAELVQQLLGFSRRSRLNLTRCDLNGIAREVQGLLKHTVDPRVEIGTTLQEDLWSVSADPTQLQQVLMNLCVNAVDSMPNGGQLMLRTQNVHVEKEEAQKSADARPGDYVLLSVKDQGHGMSQEVQNHMFEPFFTTKGPGKGTGLGLAMVYGIVKQHNGWIACQSELNRGTTFFIYLPRVGDAAQAVTVVAQQAPVSGGKERIFVVDDEPAVRGVVMIVLRKYGYEILSAADGEEAVNLFPSKQSEIDLVILDLTMPRLSGRDTFRKLREIRPDIPIIISSGYPVEMDPFTTEVGSAPNGFVQKPFEVSELARTVRAVLDAAKKKE
jgi:two-component system cell cycle sensor histidine kinase/response regulator CckA